MDFLYLNMIERIICNDSDRDHEVDDHVTSSNDLPDGNDTQEIEVEVSYDTIRIFVYK